MRLILILAVSLAAAAVRVRAAERAPDGFRAGVNYPWLDYGADFGANAWGHRGVSAPESRSMVAADFAYLRSKGVKIVRWFVFCDGRAGLQFDSRGFVTGFDEYVYPDLDAALAIARENDIRLVLVLFNFDLLNPAQQKDGVQLGGRAGLVTDERALDSLLKNALEPLLAKYGRHPAVLAWEIMNEPENRKGGDSGVELGAMQAFAKKLADAIHAGGGLATLGSAKRRDLSRWKNVGLDLYQYHNYRDAYPSPLAGAVALDKPCLLGEFPTKNSRVGLEGYLDAARDEGLVGALAWGYRSQDSYSDFKSVADRFAAWTRARP